MTATRTTQTPQTTRASEATRAPSAEHTAYSDPGPYGELLAAVPTDLERLSAVARNVIVHYRASGHDLPEETRGDSHSRWLSRALTLDQQRHGSPLATSRLPLERVQGCCRDHTLFCCAVLRQHGIPARGRVGFAGYFDDGYHHDHVVVEVWEQGESGGRWRRFDPEVTEADGLVTSPTDLATGPAAPFVTAAEAWRAWRAGDLEPARYGAGPGVLPEGPWFLQNYVIREAAHRHGDELLLWDSWGEMAGPGEPIDDAVLALTDDLAALLVAADAQEGIGAGIGAGSGPQDGDARTRLAQWYRADARLHPGATVLRFDPFGGIGDRPTRVELTPYP